jgi:hypothetical protein
VLGGSKKYCLLTVAAYEELRQAIASELTADASNFSEIARFSGVDTDSVTKILDRKTVSYSTLKKMMEGFGLELTESSYTKADPPGQTKPTVFPPNPFEQSGLWGCDELLRRIFEQLGKGGSQALIGPAGCGKSEILRAIVRKGAERLGRGEETFLYIDMRLIRDELGFFEELCTSLDIERCDQNQLRRKLLKTKRPYVLCLDTVHVLLESPFPKATPNWLRGMAEIPNSPLQLVVASRKDLQELATEHNISSPLADFFSGQTERLDYWNLERVTDFVEEHLIGTGIAFTSEEIGDLHKEGRGRPRDIRSTAARLYDWIASGVDQV